MLPGFPGSFFMYYAVTINCVAHQNTDVNYPYGFRKQS